jgi:hypothetical protein
LLGPNICVIAVCSVRAKNIGIEVSDDLLLHLECSFSLLLPLLLFNELLFVKRLFICFVLHIAAV